jgi:hypothetical protein
MVVGKKVTEIVHDVLAASVDPQVVGGVVSLKFIPVVNPMARLVRDDAVPLFSVQVMGLSALGEPTGDESKL